MLKLLPIDEKTNLAQMIDDSINRRGLCFPNTIRQQCNQA
jgi:hypothetical protein